MVPSHFRRLLDQRVSRLAELSHELSNSIGVTTNCIEQLQKHPYDREQYVQTALELALRGRNSLCSLMLEIQMLRGLTITLKDDNDA